MNPSLGDLLPGPPVLQSSLFCEEVYWDVQGRITIRNAFHGLPCMPVREFYLTNLWHHDHPDIREYHEEVRLRDPDGRLLGEVSTAAFALGGDLRYHFNYIRFRDVPFATPGSHEVTIRLLDAVDQECVLVRSIPLLIL